MLVTSKYFIQKRDNWKNSMHYQCEQMFQVKFRQNLVALCTKYKYQYTLMYSLDFATFWINFVFFIFFESSLISWRLTVGRLCVPTTSACRTCTARPSWTAATRDRNDRDGARWRTKELRRRHCCYPPRTTRRHLRGRRLIRPKCAVGRKNVAAPERHHKGCPLRLVYIGVFARRFRRTFSP